MEKSLESRESLNEITERINEIPIEEIAPDKLWDQIVHIDQDEIQQLKQKKDAIVFKITHEENGGIYNKILHLTSK
jgi:hypothetical protein